jgi:pyruvate, water dikinase
VSEDVRDQLLASYRRLGSNCVVAVRSSATGEDGRDASFAGMNQTVTNVTGEDALLDAVKRCWAALFTPRVVTYRASRDFTADPAMAVVVQQMIASEQSGVAFTTDPSTGEPGHRPRSTRRADQQLVAVSVPYLVGVQAL